MQKLTDEQNDLAINALEDCTEEWKVGETKLEDWNKVGEHFKDILACVGLKVKVLDQDSNLNTNLLKEYLGDLLGVDTTSKELVGLVDKCAIKKESVQETAFHLFSCIESMS